MIANMKLKPLFLVTLIFTFMAPAVFGGVNLKNGNFYISYTDLVVHHGDKSLKIERTYNSKSTEVGIFGFGWGSDFETYLVEQSDGSIVVYENGAGARTIFSPIRGGDDIERSVNESLDNLISGLRDFGEFATETEALALKKKLMGNEELRTAYFRKYRNLSGLKSRKSSIVKWTSGDRGVQTVERTKMGYVRRYSNGNSEFFDKEGKLVRGEDNSGYYIVCRYDNEKRLIRIADSNGSTIRLTYKNNSTKFVHQILSDRNIASYSHKGQDLVGSVDAAGNKYEFHYDNNHNLTSVVYADGFEMKLDYEPKTQFVSKVTKRSGSSTSYKYESDPENPNHHYWSIVTKKDWEGNSVSNRYEYWIDRKSGGYQYTSKILTRINGVKTVTKYNKNSLPLSIVRGKEQTNFEYDQAGLLLVKKESTSGEFVKLEYHPIHKKISKLTNNQGTTTFDYDAKGNLAFADKGEEDQLELRYNWKNQITEMIVTDRYHLTFKYNALGKPTEISLKGEGSINVEYDRYGEIKNVESEAGHEMSLKVTQAFQTLLAKVKPAGVNLSL